MFLHLFGALGVCEVFAVNPRGLEDIFIHRQAAANPLEARERVYALKPVRLCDGVLKRACNERFYERALFGIFDYALCLHLHNAVFRKQRANHIARKQTDFARARFDCHAHSVGVGVGRHKAFRAR